MFQGIFSSYFFTNLESISTTSTFEVQEIAWVGMQDSDTVVMNPLHSSNICEDMIYANWSQCKPDFMCVAQEWMHYWQSLRRGGKWQWRFYICRFVWIQRMKFRFSRVENCGFCSQNNENRTYGLLTNFQLCWNQWSSCHRLQWTSDQAWKKKCLSFLMDYSVWDLR